MKNIVHCQECNSETTNEKFCSSSCSAKFNNRNRQGCVNKDATKTGLCNCGQEVAVNIRASLKNIKCDSCKVLEDTHKFENGKLVKKKICRVCGNTEKCADKSVCKRVLLMKNCLHKYFGFRLECIGTPDVYKEFYRIKEIILDLYSENSLQEICDSVGYKHGAANLWNSLKFLDIPYRSLSQAQTRAIITGRKKLPKNDTYKSGWHTTWEGKSVFYRSSYELVYAKKLDSNKISYDMECLRIEYWDRQQSKYRIAIPDFYIPSENTIVEIKSSYFYDYISMTDKFLKYSELNYNFKLILDGIEYLEPVTI